MFVAVLKLIARENKYKNIDNILMVKEEKHILLFSGDPNAEHSNSGYISPPARYSYLPPIHVDHLFFTHYTLSYKTT